MLTFCVVPVCMTHHILCWIFLTLLHSFFKFCFWDSTLNKTPRAYQLRSAFRKVSGQQKTRKYRPQLFTPTLVLLSLATSAGFLASPHLKLTLTERQFSIIPHGLDYSVQEVGCRVCRTSLHLKSADNSEDADGFAHNLSSGHGSPFCARWGFLTETVITADLKREIHSHW